MPEITIKKGNETPAKNSDWKRKSEQLRNVLKAARGSALAAVESKVEGLYDDRKQCPHCLRRFNPEPFERHVEVCPNNKSKRTLKI